MPNLLPRMPPEPPADFVAFVGRHLASLRAEAARLVGDEQRADEVYPQALADVAARWVWFHLLRPLTGADAPAAYLHRSLATRANRWRDEQLYPVQVRRIEPDTPWAEPPAAPAPPRSVGSSVALRRAPLVIPAGSRAARPVAEAAIAWEHAYGRRRRRRFTALVVLVVLCYGTLVQIANAPPG